MKRILIAALVMALILESCSPREGGYTNTGQRRQKGYDCPPTRTGKRKDANLRF